MEKESPQSLAAGCVSDTVLSSKGVEKAFSQKQDVGVRDMAGFPFISSDCL
jgi:hypothetical protein